MKLADLGMSRAVYGSQEYVQRSADAVPVRWMSPEAAAELRFTHKRCDVQSASPLWHSWT